MLITNSFKGHITLHRSQLSSQAEDSAWFSTEMRIYDSLVLSNIGRILTSQRSKHNDPRSQRNRRPTAAALRPSQSGTAAYSRLILHSVDALDDVMQEASVVIWEKQAQLRNQAEFLPWAKTIVRNISFRYRRSAARDRHVFNDDLVNRLLGEDDLESTDNDQSAQEYAALMSCLNKFPEERKQLLLAPYRSPGAVKELAAKANRSPNSLYKLLQRLRIKLMGCVENELKSQPA